MRPAHPPPDFVAAVHEALQLFAKGVPPDSPLLNLAFVRWKGAPARRAVNDALLVALDELAVDHPDDAALLRSRFIEQKTALAVANERAVAEITVYKAQKRAVERLAATLWRMAATFAAEREAALTRWLPAPSYDALFGVDALAGQLRELIAAASAPWILSLEGLGGIGKTSLAQRLARDLAANDANCAGVAWISAQQRRFHLDRESRAAAEPALTAAGLIDALAAQLLPEEPGAAPLSTARALTALEARLRSAPFLVVVDNLETVADVDALLPTLSRLSNPTKILLTSRETFSVETGIRRFSVPELSERDALALVRHEAGLRGLAAVADASDAELRPIFDVVGGNPLALRLVTGQLHVLALPRVLDGLREARGRRVEDLYNYIYWHAWSRLPETAQDALTLMPLFADTGADFAALLRVSEMGEDALCDALELLVRLSLVNVTGDLQRRRYGIHRLTETFLLKEVIKWREGQGGGA